MAPLVVSQTAAEIDISIGARSSPTIAREEPTIVNDATKLPSRISQGTEFAINAAPDEPSSPLPPPDQPIVGNSVDIIEDSLPEAYRGGAVQSPQPLVQGDGDGDELYSATPQKEVIHRESEATSTNAVPNQSLLAEEDVVDDAFGPNGSTSATKHVDQRANKTDRANTVNELSKNGATNHSSITIANPSTRGLMREEVGNSGSAAPTGQPPSPDWISNKTHESRLNLGASVLSTGTRGKAQLPRPQRSALQSKARNGPLAGSTSALEALRNKRAPGGLNDDNVSAHEQDISLAKSAPDGKSSAHTSKPQNLKDDVHPKPLSKSAADPRKQGANDRVKQPFEMATSVQTPVSKARPGSAANLRPSAGKLRPVRKSEPEPAPAKPSAEMTRPTPASDVANESSGEGSDIIVGKKGATKQQQIAASNNKGSLKRPARASGSTAAKKDVSLDIPQSQDEYADERPSKKAKMTAKPTAKAASKALAAPKTEARKSSPKKTRPFADAAPNKAHEKVSKMNDKPASSEKRYTNVRTRGMAQAQARKGPADPSSSHSALKPSQRPLDLSESLAVAPKAPTAPPKATETFDDFEQAVMDFGEEPGHLAQEENHVDCDLSDGEELAPAVVPQPVAKQPAATEEASRKNDEVGVEQLGASQKNAIVLSDRAESSSSLSSPVVNDSDPPNLGGSNLGARGANPKTPKVYPSSPPVSKPGPDVAPYDRVRDSTKQRPTIIQFTKSGPRNQGVMSAKKAFDYSAGTNRTSAGTAKQLLGSEAGSMAKLAEKRQRVRSPTATSMVSYKSTKTAPPSNVARNVVDALAGFSKKTRSLGEASTSSEVWKQPQLTRFHRTTDETEGTIAKTVPQKQKAPQTMPLDRHGSRAYQAPEEPLQSHARHSDDASLLHAQDDDGFANIDDFEEGTFVTQTTVPIDSVAPKEQPAKVTSADLEASRELPQKQKLFRAPAVPSMLTRPEDTGSSRDPPSNTVTTKSKRVAEDEATEQPVMKRMRNENPGTISGIEVFQVRPRPPKASSMNRDPPIIQQGNAAAAQSSVDLSRRTGKASSRMSQVTASRKPSRMASHGSQKVDMNGSPVPEGFIVPERSTVLGEYSLQAELSSEGSLVDITRKAVDRAERQQRIDDRPSASNGRTVGPTSSNIKRIPSAPHEESQAITGFARADSGGPLLEDRVAVQPANPFTSSAESSLDTFNRSSTATFTEQLKQIANANKQRSHTLPNLTSNRAEPEPMVVHPDRNRPFRAFVRNRSPSPASSSDSSSDTEETTASRCDLNMWRNALLPHQMNLFDELVVIAHRLVQHIVVKEVTAANIVDEYRNRGIRIVEEMELNHAKQLREITEGLASRKKCLRKDLSECTKKLKACTSALQTEKRNDSHDASNAAEREKQVQKVMEVYCA